MNKVTKEMCIDFVKDYYRSKLVLPFFIFIIAVVVSWFWTHSVIVVATTLVISLILSVALVFNVKRKIENTDLDDFYLVDDVVVRFKKRYAPSKSGSGYNYVYTFKDHGEYTIYKSVYASVEIPLRKEKGFSRSSVAKLSSESCNEGDLFYLLILKEKKAKIITCFYKYHFELTLDDFDLVDGKYYCKK